MDDLSIGRMARAANVSADTVRYYERMGLISPRRRENSRYRAYSKADLRRLVMIRRARDIGLSIEEIATLIALRPQADPRRSKEIIARHLGAIDSKLAELRHWHTALQELLVAVSGGTVPEGFLLRCLEDESGPYASPQLDH